MPLLQAIHLAADKLYVLEKYKPEAEKEILIELANLACCNIIMNTPKGYFKQIRGLGMSIEQATQIVKVMLSQP